MKQICLCNAPQNGTHPQSITQIRDTYVDALRRLVPLAQLDHGQATKVRMFLLGLYNGEDFPYDMTNLRALDKNIFEDCVLVLRLDVEFGREIHKYHVDGERIFSRLAIDNYERSRRR